MCSRKRPPPCDGLKDAHSGSKYGELSTGIAEEAIMAVTRDIAGEAEPRLAIEVAELYPPQGEWTEAEYFALPETNRLVELSEGVLIMPPHPTYTHQRIVWMLSRCINDFVEAHNLGVICFAPLPVRLWPGKIREPDIFFISHAHADRVGEQYCGPPDLVVEVISPGTRHIDRDEKLAEYARAGVSECWLVDPEAKTIEVFVLEGSVYTLLGRFLPGQVAHSQLLTGFQVAVDEVFAILLVGREPG
jgi:Uma2 family endonuclease